MAGFNCCSLTCIQVSQKIVRVVWYSHLFKNFPQFVVIHTVKCFNRVNKTEVIVESNYFLYDPVDVGSLFTGSSAFSKPRLYIWKFSMHVLLKPSMKDFEHNLTSMGNESNCLVVGTFFGTVLLWNWNENCSFPVLWPLLNFQICWHIECSTFTASSFKIWNSSAVIPSPPLALLVILLLKT